MYKSYKSLSKAIDEKSTTEQEAQALYNFAMKGTHKGSETQRLLYGIKYPDRVNALRSYGIYNRVMFCADETGNIEIHYTAGQSYPDEIRTVRECLCGK
jgi:hypothetical protein